MTPERMEQLKELRRIRDKLGVAFKEARDNWTKACSDFNYALLKEYDYYQYIRGNTKFPPDWLAEVKGKKEVITKKKIDEMVDFMLKQQEPKKEGNKNVSNWKSLW